MPLLSILPGLWQVGDSISHPMHIPDGFLSNLIAAILWLVTVGSIALAVRNLNKTLGERQIPLVGVIAAAIFAMQMLNFPVAGGTSGHLLGGALAAIVLGPWAAFLAMAAVIGVQGLIFQDGGLVVMGANIFNMGIFTAMIGYGIFRMAAGRPRAVQLGVAGVAAWLSVMGGALLTALEIWLSGNADAAVIFPSMLGVHALIGIGEALITVGALSFIMAARPDLLSSSTVKGHGSAGWVPVGVALAVAITFLSPFASGDPDGLERVAGDLGFLDLGQSAPYQILPDYTVPFISDPTITTIASGIIGALVVFGILYLIVRVVRRSPA